MDLVLPFNWRDNLLVQSYIIEDKVRKSMGDEIKGLNKLADDQKKVDEFKQYLLDYTPILEKLSKDPNLAPDLHKECEELLELKEKAGGDPKSYLNKHPIGMASLAFSYGKLRRLSVPFCEELSDQTYQDVLDADKKHNWREVLQDIHFLNELHTAQESSLWQIIFKRPNRKAAQEDTNEDMSHINERLHESGWLPTVTIDGIAYHDHLQFTVDGKKRVIGPDGKLIDEPGKDISDLLKQNEQMNKPENIQHVPFFE